MTDYIVTVKLPKHPLHDPNNKKTGKCPIDGSTCTDVTGAHHSALIRNTSATIVEVQAEYESLGIHVTRIEVVDSP